MSTTAEGCMLKSLSGSLTETISRTCELMAKMLPNRWHCIGGASRLVGCCEESETCRYPVLISTVSWTLPGTSAILPTAIRRASLHKRIDGLRKTHESLVRDFQVPMRLNQLVSNRKKKVYFPVIWTSERTLT